MKSYTLFRCPVNNNCSHLKQTADPHEVSASVWLNSHEMDCAYVLFSWQKVWHWKKYIWNGTMFSTGTMHAGKIGAALLKLEMQEIAVVFPCSTYSLVKQEQHKDTCLPDSNEGNKDNRRKENCKMFFPKQTNTTVDCVPVFYSKLVIYPSTHCLVNMLHKVAASGLRSWYLQPQTAANHREASSS